MLRSVFTHALWSRRRALAWWAAGAFVYVLVISSAFPAVADAGASIDELLRDYPAALKSLFGIPDDVAYTSAPGFLQTQFFGFVLPLLFLILTIPRAGRAIAGEEHDRTLELVLTSGVARRRIVADKFAAIAAEAGLLAVALTAGLGLGTVVFDMDVAVADIAAGVASGLLLGLASAAITLAVGAATGRRAVAIGAGAAVALAGFMAVSLAGVADWLDTPQKLLPFYYYAASQPLLEGLSALHAATLAAVAAAGTTLAAVAIGRRDVVR